MPDMKLTENVKAKGKLGVLKLKRETLRELDAGELKQVQGGARPETRGYSYRCNTFSHVARCC